MAHLRSCLALPCLATAVLLANGTAAQGVVPAAPAGAVASAVASAPPPVTAAAPPPAPAADTEGDRADAIARDSVLHPPQKPAAQGSTRLRTIELKLGGLLDRSVHGTENSEVGRVIDVLVGDDGRPAALELDVGGFMGVGNRKIAVAWALFDVAKPGNEPLRVALTEGQVRSAPAAEGAGAVAVVAGASGLAAVPTQARGTAGARPAAMPSLTAPAAVPAEGAASAPPGVPALGLTISPALVPPIPAPPAVGAVPKPANAAREAGRDPSASAPVPAPPIPAPPAQAAGPLPRRPASPSGRR